MSTNRAQAKAEGRKFYQGKPCKYGHQGNRYVQGRRCVECSTHRSVFHNKSDWMAQWRANNSEQIKIKKYNYRLKKVYGLSKEEHDSLLQKQGGVCAICKVHPSEAPHGRLCVDHCHTTGKVRGLLCHHCNAGLGHMKDSAKLLILAASYLGEQ